MSTYFANASNNYIEPATSALSWLWVLIFGWMYFIVREVWGHAILLLFVQGALAGGATFAKLKGFELLGAIIVTWILPAVPHALLVSRIMERRYRRAGWIEVDPPRKGRRRAERGDGLQPPPRL